MQPQDQMNQFNQPNQVPVQDEAPKRENKYVPMIVILAILMIGGLAFGGYELWQNMQKDEEIKTLQTENEKIKEQKENVIVETNQTTTVSASISGGPYIEDNYFYVPDWGVKFKIPDELDNYGYSVNYNKAQSSLPTIGFTAMLKTDVHTAQTRYYDDIATCAVVSVSREQGTWPNNQVINGVVKQFDDYALLIWNYTAHDSCDYKLHINEVQEKIQTMFSNPENI